jgi:hypothetical protein
MSGATTSLRVPGAAYVGLGHISENSGALSVLKEVSRVGTSASKIATEFARRAGISGEAARDILTQLAGLHTTRELLEAEPEEVFDAITSSLEREAPSDWRDKYLARWKAAREQVVDALRPDHPLAVVNKTTQLNFAHQNILRSSRVITDVRPVFDATGESVVQSILTHSLVLDYSDSTTNHSIYLTLDAADLGKLRRACERAERKALAAKKAFEGGGLALIVAGEDPDDNGS